MFDLEAFNRARIGHGILMSLSCVLFFPAGAILIRILRSPNAVRLHMIWQCLSLAILVAGFGLGLWIQREISIEWSDPHQFIGTVIVVLFLLMPLAGAFSHWRYEHTKQSTIVGRVHVWLGRTLIALGLITGGFGLKLANEGNGPKVAYIVFAVLTVVTYVTMLVWWYRSGKARNKAGSDIRVSDVALEDRGQ